MSAKLPYMTTPGLVPKILTKMQEARKPDRFTQDFLETKLGFAGGSARPIISLLKRMGFLNTDGTPTALYDKFRNADTQAATVAEGIRSAYAELFDRNRYAGDLSKDKLRALIMETTGAAHDDRTVEVTVSTFLKLKELADFDARLPEPSKSVVPESSIEIATPKFGTPAQAGRDALPMADESGVGLNLAYTINLVLPETTNPEVFNTIFRSLKENLLRKS